MHLHARASWQVSYSDFPQAEVAALYVRDAAGLQPVMTPDLPPLAPAVPVRPVPGVDVRVAAEQWARWWGRRDVHVPQSLPMPVEEQWQQVADGPELRAVLAAHFMDGLRWCSRMRSQQHAALPPHRRHQRVAAGELVRELEEEAGRGARAFALYVTELPLAGAGSWLVGEELIVTCAFLDEQPVARERLREILAQRV
ncbi:hypothetical protein GCM10027586_09200 [Kineococcus gypseus]|uniref:hypothetical protein n=1 Tax=Kineococcus gypseus TaxID=1637102 RepID=UPI003D7E0D29